MTACAGPENPFKAALSRACWDQGVEARQARRGAGACPYREDDQRPQWRAWLEGWKAAAPPPRVEHRDPVVVHREPKMSTRTPAFWPAGEPLPAAYVKPKPIPCKHCRRWYLATGRQAVVMCSGSRHGQAATFRCKACRRTFAYPVQGS